MKVSEIITMPDFWFRSARPVEQACRHSMSKLEDRIAEARGKGFLAFSLKSAAGGRSSNLYQCITCP